ncbi:MAG TPA: SCO family protein [Rhizomicrobium sp.]|jgi:protein SCO1/2
MRWAVLLLAFALVACGKSEQRPGVTDVTGASPDLAFSMTRASDGAAVNAGDYLGKVAIVYFGYTNCPDVCPATLADLTDALQKLGPHAAAVQVLFVTVDPARDTLAKLKQYTAAFDPHIDGLRGTPNELLRFARRFRVAYDVQTSPKYEVMHSESVFFFDPQGHARLVALSTENTTAMAKDMMRLLADR